MARSRRRGGGSSAKAGSLFGKKAAPAARPAARAPARGSVFGGPSASRTPPPPSRTPPPPAAAPTPPPAAAPQQSGGMLSGLGGMVAQGMAIGTGSAIAHQAVNGIMGSFSGGGSKAEPEVHQQTQAQPLPQQSAASGVCAYDQEELYRCLKEQNGDAAQCQYFFDALKQCQDNQRYAL